ncbi:MAG TPA: prepilin-type N-terminal cleavage/methylation domain-containing protein [Bacillota bacterium]|nr:prepilin-type N-terminal cleavage/methylation domain-containing protein [Bacillota bacterium]
MPHNQDRTNAGFSLLEVLIAITITGLIISIISNALMQNGRNQKVLEERVTAQILGQGKLSEIIYGSESGSAGDFAAPYQKYHWYASSETLPDGYTKILLLLEWRDGRALLHQKTLIGYSHP